MLTFLKLSLVEPARPEVFTQQTADSHKAHVIRVESDQVHSEMLSQKPMLHRAVSAELN